MGLSIGIVGLPNVGKSTLFNALTKAGAASSNYPFCTIDPNVGVVNVPDERLDKLTEISASKKTVPATVEFIDIAGLVRGAAQGEGLGNQFLSHIRGVDAVAQVVRVFEDSDVIHIGEVDPVRDIEIINTELMLKDLETVDNILPKREKTAKTGDKESAYEVEVLKKLKDKLQAGVLVRNAGLDDKAASIMKQYQFLTAKDIILVANIGEDQIKTYSDNPQFKKLAAKAAELGADVVPISAKIEQELSELEPADQKEYLAELGLTSSGLERLIVESYKLLGLITFLTTGEKESRAWTIRRGTKAPQAAGVIHTDFEKGFIRMETAGYDEFVKAGSWAALKDKGLARMEGKDYVVQDGDVVVFHFS